MELLHNSFFHTLLATIPLDKFKDNEILRIQNAKFPAATSTNLQKRLLVVAGKMGENPRKFVETHLLPGL